MKSISFLILVALFLSSCHLSMDFAKRKYRPGYYVNLSSNKKEKFKISNTHSKEFDKKIADLTPIPSKREAISDNHQPSIINHQYLSQTTPIYNRSEKRVLEENSYVNYKSSDEQEKKRDGIGHGRWAFLLAFLALVALIILALLALIGLVKFTLLAFLLIFLITIVALFLFCLIIFLNMGDRHRPTTNYPPPKNK
jgi:uncharacterized membrane protein